MRLIAALLILSCLVLVESAFAGTRQVRVFDPARQVKTALTLGDFVPSSAAWVSENGSSALSVTFTPTGRKKFCILTRALAQRGVRVGVPQRLAFAVDGRTYADPTVNFKLFPHGLCGSPGLQVYLRASLAQRLAQLIRG